MAIGHISHRQKACHQAIQSQIKPLTLTRDMVPQDIILCVVGLVEQLSTRVYGGLAQDRGEREAYARILKLLKDTNYV